MLCVNEVRIEERYALPKSDSTSISIWLDVDLRDLKKRTKWNNKRPLLNKENKEKVINKLYEDRKSIYKLANYKINCNNLSKKNIAKKIITLYEKHQTHN